jgi:hypothetical protein
MRQKMSVSLVEVLVVIGIIASLISLAVRRECCNMKLIKVLISQEQTKDHGDGHGYWNQKNDSRSNR